MAGLESSLKVRYTVRVRISEVRLGTLVKSWFNGGLRVCPVLDPR